MQPEPISVQVVRLKRRVEMLEQLPDQLDRLESQILQFRQETRDESSAAHADMRERVGELRVEMRNMQ